MCYINTNNIRSWVVNYDFFFKFQSWIVWDSLDDQRDTAEIVHNISVTLRESNRLCQQLYEYMLAAEA